MKIVMDPTITMLVTLDKSQASGKHEKALLDADKSHDLAACRTQALRLNAESDFAVAGFHLALDRTLIPV